MTGKTLQFSYDVAPLADAAARSHKSPRKYLIALKAKTTNTSPQNLASMTFSAHEFTMKCKRHVPS
jgi:hypothetical protein